jgi:hypothetical protein
MGGGLPEVIPMPTRPVRWLVLGLGRLTGARLGAAEAISEQRSPAAVEERLRKDVTYLASPQLEGRGITTQGINVAADYVADEFKKAGLAPGGKNGSYFQPFAMPGAALNKPARLTLQGPKGQQIELRAGEHFQPMGLSHSGKLTAPVVFAGYGVTSPKDPAVDEYDGLDVEGKVVVVLRDTFRADNRHALGSNWRRRYGSLTEKMKNAEAHKAAAILFVNDRDTAADGDDLLTFGFTAAAPSPHKLPAFHVRRAVVERLLGEDLAQLERDIDRDLRPRSRELPGWTASLEADVTHGKEVIPLKNVVGVLEGSGKLANQTVVIGAHYDHVGYGGSASLSGSKKMAVHHGADDNASGTSMLLELARRFAQVPKREGRRLVFLAFSAEESGLIGSEYYAKNPLFPMEQTVAMVNMDMVGRLDKDKTTGRERLTVYGTGTAKTFEELIDSLNKKHDFQLKKVASGMGPSDQMSFYTRKVPVFFFFTNDHPDYHRPSDTADKINVPGMRRVADLVEEVTAHLAAVPEPPEYVKVTGPAMAGMGDAPRLGVRPDYGDDGEGVLLSGVNEGTPAEKAGLKEGDRILELGGKPVKGLEGYMVLMRTFKKGDTIDITALRGGKKVALKAKLE